MRDHGRRIPRRPRVPGRAAGALPAPVLRRRARAGSGRRRCRPSPDRARRGRARRPSTRSGSSRACSPAAAPIRREPQLRLLVANVWYPGNDYRPLLELVERERPDVIGLTELSRDWAAGISRGPRGLPAPRAAGAAGRVRDRRSTAACRCGTRASSTRPRNWPPVARATVHGERPRASSCFVLHSPVGDPKRRGASGIASSCGTWARWLGAQARRRFSAATSTPLPGPGPSRSCATAGGSSATTRGVRSSGRVPVWNRFLRVPIDQCLAGTATLRLVEDGPGDRLGPLPAARRGLDAERSAQTLCSCNTSAAGNPHGYVGRRDFVLQEHKASSERGDEALEVVLVRPPAARDADEAGAGQVADDDSRVEERRDEGRRILGAEGDERRVRRGRRRRAAPGAPGSARPSPRRARSAIRAAARARRRARRGSRSRPSRGRTGPLRRPARSCPSPRRRSARSSSAGRHAAAPGRRRRARPSRPGRRATSGRRWSGSRGPARRRGSRRPTAPRRRARARRTAREAPAPGARGRSSRAPARARAGASAASPPRGSPPARRRRRRRGRRSRATGPSRPKCSSRVVTISSSGPRSSPPRTMLQPSVVEPVSDTCSAGAPTSDPSAARASVRKPSIRSKYSFPKRPCSSSSSSCARTASAVGCATGPKVPALR